VSENVDDEAHWPASDDHPTHEEHPEFDPRKPVQPNTEWSFTFERPGQWKYHDHMNPYLSSSSCANGVFMENFSVDQRFHLSKFLKESDPFYPCMEQAERHKPDCYLYAPTYYLSLHPEDYAGALKWRNDAEAGFESACASGVGMQALKENLDGPKLIESVCMGGQSEQTAPCIVGMTSLYISHHGSLEPARELCARLEAPNRRPSYVSVVTHRSLFRS
jgi:hypothetical protein